jgi:UDP-glucose 4-epimerase
MRALVIGGSGFIGTHLVDALLAKGKKVRVFNRSLERFRATPNGVEFMQGHFDDSAMLAEALTDVDQVFHLVSSMVPGTSNMDPVADIQDNLINTVRLLQLMRGAGIKRMVFMSSGGTVYGIPKTDPIAEDHPRHPISSYGIVKVAIENYLHMEHHLHGLSPMILRAANPYGPRQGHMGVQGVIGTVLWKIAQGDPIQIWGDGSVVRDFIHVRDLATLCSNVSDTEITGFFNVGSGIGHSINEVIDMIAKVIGIDVQPSYKPSRGFDVPRVVLDISAIRQATSWSPTITLEEGILETWDWVQGQMQ